MDNLARALAVTLSLPRALSTKERASASRLRQRWSIDVESLSRWPLPGRWRNSFFVMHLNTRFWCNPGDWLLLVLEPGSLCRNFHLPLFWRKENLMITVFIFNHATLPQNLIHWLRQYTHMRDRHYFICTGPTSWLWVYYPLCQPLCLFHIFLLYWLWQWLLNNVA